jgi:hypothetical protein
VLAAVLGLVLLVGGVLAVVAERERQARTEIADTAERERRERAEKSIDDVAAMYQKADWFRNKAQQIPPEQLELWGQALGQVRRTAEIIGKGVADEDTEEGRSNR